MAYTINLTNGTVLTTIADGTVNDTSSSLTLIGKNFSGYGTYLNDNLVHMLENNANDTPPTTPLTGQLWWDSAGNLNVYTGAGFVNLAAITSSTSQPTGPKTGNQWWDTTNQQFNVYNGSGWTLVGPAFTSNTGQSGTLVGTILDSNAASHVAVNVYVSNTLVAIVSKDSTYTPATSITGFSTIKPGFNLVSTSAVTGVAYWGTASDASSLGNVAAANYARTDSGASSETFDIPIYVNNNNGITVGTANTFSMSVSTSTVRLDNNINNADIAVRANIGGTMANAITVTGSTGNVRVVNTLYTANTVPTTANTYSLGSSSSWYSTVYATAVQSLYADFAERFEADDYYEPGTVVEIGGEKEVTLAVNELSDDVFGVVSTNPAHLLNSNAGSNETHPPIAVNGRVPVKVIGRVRKGDRLVSAGKGYARSGSKAEITPYNLIGRSLESKTDDGKGTVMAIVKLNS